jgi:hypothetical protein
MCKLTYDVIIPKIRETGRNCIEPISRTITGQTFSFADLKCENDEDAELKHVRRLLNERDIRVLKAPH